jgi:hypothetical protein
MLLGGMFFLAIGSGIFLGPSVVNAEINDRLADCNASMSLREERIQRPKQPAQQR